MSSVAFAATNFSTTVDNTKVFETSSSPLGGISGCFMQTGSHYYATEVITIPLDGTYTFETTNGVDPFIAIYDTSFDASNPTNNLVACDDDSGVYYHSKIIKTLTAGEQYMVLITSSRQNLSNTITWEISPNVVLGYTPEINVLANNTTIVDGDTSPSSLDYTDFELADIDGGSIERTFTISNTGLEILNLKGINISGSHAADFTLTTDANSSIASSGGETTFVITFNPSATGLRSASISINNDDVNENPYNFTIQGTGFASPVFSSSSTQNISENNTTITTVTATDVDSASLSFTLNGGADQSLFNITSNGVLTFKTAPDFENPSDSDTNNTYVVIVQASDGTNTTDQTITVTVTNVNDNSPIFTSNSTPNIAENQTSIITTVATDADSDSLTYSLNGGADTAKFEITSAGVLTFKTAPDFENPSDADTNNTYVVIVQASDGTKTTNQTITVTVTNVNDNSPVFTSNSTLSIAENNTSIITTVATDADNESLTYSLNGGADNALFEITSAGVLTFKTAPDFENPSDADTNNSYVVIVQVSDGTNTTDHTLTISVTNTNDTPPSFSSNNALNVAEGNTAIITTTATDVEGGTITFSLNGGADSALFNITSNGVLTFKTAPDFENPSDSDTNNTYVVIVQASDGTNTTDQTITVTVTNLNDNSPIFTSNSTPSIAENQTSIITTVATDADNDSLTYSLNGGADATKFEITSAGVLTFKTAPDFENPSDADTNNSYIVIVQVSDGTNTIDQTITVTVTNGNDHSPVFSSDSTLSVAEGNTSVMNITATDADGDTVTFSLNNEADNALFDITSDGVLTFKTAPDFENPNDADQDNSYVVVIQANDGLNTTDQTITVNVTNISDSAPVFTSSATPNIEEGNTSIITTTATDADNDSVTYSFNGGADNALFEITSAGVLTFKTAPDFENPTDADTNNTYIVIVQASDGINTTDQTITVTVTDKNDNLPSFTTPSTFSIVEGNTEITTLNVADADNDTISFSINGGADSSHFQITDSGTLSFNILPYIQAPQDADSNNIYIVIVQATDGNNTIDQTITVTVTADEVAPVLTEVTPVPNPTSNITPTYRYRVSEKSTIKAGGDCSFEDKTAASSGEHTVTFNTLEIGNTYSNCTLTATDVVGNVSNTLNIPAFKIDYRIYFKGYDWNDRGEENNNGTPRNVGFTVRVEPINLTGSAITGNIAYGGSATEGTDYAPGVTNFSIPDGSSSTSISLTVIEDAIFESTESVTATISNPSTGFLGISSVTSYIYNDDCSNENSYCIAISRNSDGAEKNNGTPNSASFNITVMKNILSPLAPVAMAQKKIMVHQQILFIPLVCQSQMTAVQTSQAIFLTVVQQPMV